MNQEICRSVSSYAEISCDDQISVNEIALPFMQIAVLLIIIIILAAVGIIIKRYGKEVRQAANTSAMNAVTAQVEQEKILGQK